MTQAAVAPTISTIAVHPAPYRARPAPPAPPPASSAPPAAAIAAELELIAASLFDLAPAQVRNRIRMAMAALDQLGDDAARDARTELAFVDLQLGALCLDMVAHVLGLAAGMLTGER